MKYLWDTNNVIYYLQKQFPLIAEEFINDILKNEQPAFSAITEIELLCWKPEKEEDIEIVKNFIKDSLVIELEQIIKLKSADVRKKYKTKLPDAIIAATALIYDLTLVTRNEDDFKNVKNLRIINPWKL